MNTLYVSVSHHVHNDPRSSFTSHTKGTIDPFQSLKTAGTYIPLNSIYYGLPPASPPTGIHKVRPRYKKLKKKSTSYTGSRKTQTLTYLLHGAESFLRS